MMRLNSGLNTLACIGMLLFITACAGNPFGDAKVLPLNNAVRTGDVVTINSHAPVKLSVGAFTDQRNGFSKNEVGTMEKDVVVYGIKGPQLFADGSISQIVSQAVRAQFAAGGYQLVDAQDADFLLTGTISDYRVNIGARDTVSMTVVVQLNKTANQTVVWSGEITLQDERFAGVGGNSSKTITTFLSVSQKKLAVKIYNAITTGLMRSHAALFVDPAAVPAVGAVVGVKILTQTSPIAPPSPIKSTVMEESSAAENVGQLVITTKPDRAGLTVDGVYFGLTPIDIELAPGIHTLRIVRDGYQPIEKKVSVRKLKKTELPLVLEMK